MATDTMDKSTSVAFNSGASVPDTVALSRTHEDIITAWRNSMDREPAQKVRLVKLAHMRYQHPDLEEITEFLRDFGMHIAKQTDDRIWFRGYGTDQYVYFAQKGPKKFLGGTFEVESYEDLEKASRLEGASQIEKIDDAPGGGSIVSVVDPEGNLINLMFGQEPADPKEFPKKLTVNYELEKPREKSFLRFQEGPAAVHRLGHYGLCVRDFQTQAKWYTNNFNFAPTDFLYVDSEDGGKKAVAVFAHVDRGQDLVDHHTMFLSTAAKSHVHHCSFEVHDMDTQQLGHQWLANKGYKSVWGVGRHILGSQLFDYWWDTTGNMVEHYADGDLVNENTPIGTLPAGDESLAVWGPDVPKVFLD